MKKHSLHWSFWSLVVQSDSGAENELCRNLCRPDVSLWRSTLKQHKSRARARARALFTWSINKGNLSPNCITSALWWSATLRLHTQGNFYVLRRMRWDTQAYPLAKTVKDRYAKKDLDTTKAR